MMRTVVRCLVFSIILLFLPNTPALSQGATHPGRAEKAEPRDLGKNLAITLVMEPSEDPDGITVFVADRHFGLNSTYDSAESRVQLSFDGELSPRGGTTYLARYHLRLEHVAKNDRGGQQFDLNGSVILKLDTQITISKSKDRVFKLKISPAS